jgi:tetratricopeptide (TPR) repeat protein
MEENPSSTEKPYQEIFQAGIFSFERGDYQGAIAQFQQALSQVNAKTQVGGEIQIWLANAYDATGNDTEAIALCRKLKAHSDRDVRKSANYVLGILSAPKLEQLKDAVSIIPSLQTLDLSNSPAKSAASSQAVVNLRRDQEFPLSDPNNSRSRQQNSWFIWTTCAIILAGLIVWAVI